MRETLLGVFVAIQVACTGVIDGDLKMPDVTPPTPVNASRHLDILPRQDWTGYAGETAIQTTALYHGTYASQKVVRTLAGGPVMFTNAAMALDGLHLTHSAWTATTPQYNNFVQWMKTLIEAGTPVMYGAYSSAVTTGTADYDTIIPGYGIDALTMNLYSDTDTLTSSDNNATKVMSIVNRYGATRTDCTNLGVDDDGNGQLCLPKEHQSGVAVSGIVDPDKATTPVTVKLDLDYEPDPANNEPPVPLHATVIAHQLVPGNAYTILRFDDLTKVPTSGSSATLLAAMASQHYDFIASEDLYTFTDPNTFQSDGTATYRVVSR